MKITDLLKKNTPSRSFEVFPPKTETGFDSVRAATEEIAKLRAAQAAQGVDGAAGPYIPPEHDGEVPFLQLEDIYKIYQMGSEEVHANDGISVNIYHGEFVAIVGKSGSGKSTLMNIIGVLDRPTKGSYLLDGVNVHEAADDELARIRNQKIGFVFQTYNLIARQSALKNVEIPVLYAGIKPAERTRRAKEWLERVGMGDRYKHQPNELSGGQKQRVAIARAMVNEPALILADEPTGALDSETSRLVMDIFHDMHEKYNKTIVLITHNPALAEECQRVITLKDGLVVDERKGGGLPWD